MSDRVVLLLQAASTAVALVLLAVCWRWPRAGRGLWVLIFAWAGPWNLFTVLTQPEAYLNYAQWAWSDGYRAFILGPFAVHTMAFVGAIALGQIAVAVLSAARGGAVKLGLAGGIGFLAAITPLGPGSGFPFTLVAIAAAAVLWRHPWPRWLLARLTARGDCSQFVRIGGFASAT